MNDKKFKIFMAIFNFTWYSCVVAYFLWSNELTTMQVVEILAIATLLYVMLQRRD